MLNLSKFYQQFNETTVVLISLSLILFSGFLVTRLTKLLRLPNVSGFIVAGVLIGPCVLGAVPASVYTNMGFVSDIALAFIAFDVGKFFKKDVLRTTGKKTVGITLAESLAAGVAVTLTMRFLFHMHWDFSLLLGAIATATAPASTMMTINQYHARGGFVNTLLQVVALDDVVCLLVFSAVIAVVGKSGEALAASDILLPILWNLLALALGFVCGVILSKLLTAKRSRDNRLILVIAMLLGISGLCAVVDISPLLSCMVFGASYINLTRDKELYRQMNHFTPPVMSIFFIVSGMNLDVRALGAVGLVGVAYFLIRIGGKYLGAFLGCIAARENRAVRDNLGLALIPQAGVAIGLAFMAQRMLPPELGSLLLTVILSSSVLYELIGPACAKAALFRSGAISKTEPEKKPEPVPSQALPEAKLEEESASLPKKAVPVSENG